MSATTNELLKSLRVITPPSKHPSALYDLSPYQWAGQIQCLYSTTTSVTSYNPKIPDFTIPYIDDVPIKGPATRDIQSDGTAKTIPGNRGIRHFCYDCGGWSITDRGGERTIVMENVHSVASSAHSSMTTELRR